MDIYKSFVFESLLEDEISDFSLMPITDVYSDVNNGKEVYFLNALNETVKVVGISKEPYKGKIYDVDVENDVVLVRRVDDKKLNVSSSFDKDYTLNSEHSQASNIGQGWVSDSGKGQASDSGQSSGPKFWTEGRRNKAGLEERRLDWGSFDSRYSNEFDLTGAVWSGNSNNGTAKGNAVQTDAGKLGKGFEFDGDGDYVDVGNSSSLNMTTNNFTVSVWVYNRQSGALRPIINKGNSRADPGRGFQLNWDNGNKIWIYAGDGAVGNRYISGSISVQAGNWYHVLVSYIYNGSDWGQSKLYVNGVQDGGSSNLNQVTGSITTTSSLEFGSYLLSGNFNGTIDDVMLFNRSLSAEEIRGLYANQSLRYLGVNYTSLSEGAHTFKAYTQDIAGNVNYTELRSVTVDLTQPSFSNNQTNSTATTPRFNEVIQLNLTLSDNIELDGYFFAHNDTGTMTNGSYRDISGTSYTLIENITIANLKYNDVLGWQVWVNDTANNVNVSSIYTLVIKNTNLTLSNAVNGSINFRKWENFSANITINDADNQLGYYTFSTNNSGSWQNDSIVSISGGSYYANSTKNISLAQGNYICWKYYANDTANSLQTSSEYCFTVANTVPTHITPAITSSDLSNRTNGTLTCNNQSTNDVDSDSVTNYYRWYRNNSLLSDQTSSTLASSQYNKTSGIICEITPGDTINNGTIRNSTTMVFQNTAPSINVTIPNRTVNQSSFWEFDANASDNDVSDNVDSLTWHINNSMLTIDSSTGNISDTPLENETGNYTINVTVSDRIVNDSQIFYYTILDNVKPTINTVTVSPTIGAIGTIFNITANVTDGKQVDSVIANIQKPDENNTASITLSLNNGLYNGSWNSSGKAEGTYVIDITANDTSGNEKEKENGAVIALSSNAQNVSVNSSVSIIANTSTIINFTTETDTWLNLTVTVNVNASITVAKYSENIEPVDPTGVTELGKYIDIVVDNNTNNNLSYAIVRVYYTDNEVVAANLQESTLRLYKFNSSSGLWFMPNGGVDTILNYVWGNVTSFSSFGIFGTAVSVAAAAEAAAVAGRAGGLCEAEWNCSEWSECVEGVQYRRCVRKGTCFMGEKPEEERECEYVAPEIEYEEEVEEERELEIPAPEEKRLSIKVILIVWLIMLFVLIFWKVSKRNP